MKDLVTTMDARPSPIAALEKMPGLFQGYTEAVPRVDAATHKGLELSQERRQLEHRRSQTTLSAGGEGSARVGRRGKGGGRAP